MNRIKELRIEKGLLQSDVAKYINKSERMVGFYENGKRDPNTDTLIKLSELLDASVDYILGKSDIRNPEEIDNSKINVAFSSGYDGLNETNQNIINATIAGLLAKQKEEENKNKKEN